MRPARALIGWMPEEEALMLLGVPETPLTPLPQHIHRVQTAQNAVRARRSGVEQERVLSEAGEELQAYAAALKESPQYRRYFAGDWTIKIVDLQKLCALQPIVHLDYAERSGQPEEALPAPDDMLGLARLTLPMHNRNHLPQAEFDAQHSVWKLNTCNTDAKIVGQYNQQIEIQPGLFGAIYGFCIAETPSAAQVVRYRGRYLLTDGYHRSLMLLRSGVSHLPALYREYAPTEEIHVDGRFANEILLGERPPLLSDYLRDDVAAQVSHFACKKVIAIQAEQSLSWG